MYTGHAAIALALKSCDPRVPLVPLAIACYGPDWIEVALMIPRARAGMAIYTHSIPAVMIGAVTASGLYALIARRPGARMILLAWLLHWPADLFTGRKPLIGLRPLIGLDLYHVPAADAVLEMVVIGVACTIYWRAFARTPAQRRLVLALGAVLALLQVTMDFVVSRIDKQPWNPSLAQERQRIHLSLSASGAVPAGAPHASCTHPHALFTASGSWGQTG